MISKAPSYVRLKTISLATALALTFTNTAQAQQQGCFYVPFSDKIVVSKVTQTRTSTRPNSGFFTLEVKDGANGPVAGHILLNYHNMRVHPKRNAVKIGALQRGIPGNITFNFLYQISSSARQRFGYAISSPNINLIDTTHLLQGDAIGPSNLPGRVERGDYTYEYSNIPDGVEVIYSNKRNHFYAGTPVVVEQGDNLASGETIYRKGRAAGGKALLYEFLDTRFTMNSNSIYQITGQNKNGRAGEGNESTGFALSPQSTYLKCDEVITQ